MVDDEDRRQVERLENLMKAFEWTIVSIDYSDEATKVTLTRPTTGKPAESAAGPG